MLPWSRYYVGLLYPLNISMTKTVSLQGFRERMVGWALTEWWRQVVRKSKPWEKSNVALWRHRVRSRWRAQETPDRVDINSHPIYYFFFRWTCSILVILFISQFWSTEATNMFVRLWFLTLFSNSLTKLSFTLLIITMVLISLWMEKFGYHMSQEVCVQFPSLDTQLLVTWGNNLHIMKIYFSHLSNEDKNPHLAHTMVVPMKSDNWRSVFWKQ